MPSDSVSAAFALLAIVVAGGVVVAIEGVGWAYGGVGSVESEIGIHSNLPQINEAWVMQFMNDTNQYRPSSPLSYNPSLDNFSELRFGTMTGDYEISHYGFDQDIASYFGSVNQQIAIGEVVYFPAGTTPQQYLQGIQDNSPGHWQTMMDTAYHSFGYYIGQGPTYEVDKGCPTVEVPGPNINMSTYFTQEGCSFTIVNSTWLVIDFTS